MAEAKKKRRKPKWIWLRRSILAETLETLKSLIAESEDGSEEERTDARSVMAKLAALIGEKQSHPNWSSADIVTLHRPTTPPAPAVEGDAPLKELMRLAHDVRWLELSQGEPFTTVDREMLRDLYDAAEELSESRATPPAPAVESGEIEATEYEARLIQALSEIDKAVNFIKTNLAGATSKFLAKSTLSEIESASSRATNAASGLLTLLHRADRLRSRTAGGVTEEMDALRAAKDGAYRERDQLVCALSKLFPAWLERHPENDKEWEDDWRWIVFIEIPVRTYKLFGDQRLQRSAKDIFEDKPQQVSWHIHDSEISWFSHLTKSGANSWDGHTTPEKYRRLAALAAQEGQ